MKTFAELELLELSWVKARSTGLFRPTVFQLLDKHDQVMATLTRSKLSHAQVDAPGNRWMLERKVSLFKPPVISITSVGTGEQPAVFEVHGASGALVYPDGCVFHWSPVNWMGKKWVWTDATGHPVLGIEMQNAWQSHADIHIDPEIEREKAPPLLLFLGWFLILLYQDDSSVTGLSVG